MILSDKQYNVLKWVGLIVLPAIATLVKAVFPVWDLPYADAIATTCTALGVFVGTLIGVSQANMKPELDADEEAVVEFVEEENQKETNGVG
nr:MAG TPA: holin [Caudoviricetes sp.]